MRRNIRKYILVVMVTGLLVFANDTIDAQLVPETDYEALLSVVDSDKPAAKSPAAGPSFSVRSPSPGVPSVSGENPAGKTAKDKGSSTEEESLDKAAAPVRAFGTKKFDKESEKEAKPKVADLTKRVTVDLRNMDIIDALAYLGLRSGLNIVTSKNVTGRVTFQLKDVPLQDIFDVTLLSNNLAYEKRGEIVYVMTDKEYEARYGRIFSDVRKVKVFHLNYAIPDKAFDLLDTMKSTLGRILVDQETGTVFIMDTPEKIEQMTKALGTLEEKGMTKVFDLKYAVASEVEEKLRNQIDNKNLGNVWSDERSNQVIVHTLPDRMEGVEKIIAALDQKTKEVLIDVKIIKIKLNDELNIGFQWEGFFTELASNGFMGTHSLDPVERLNQTFIDDYTTIQPTDSNPAAGKKTTFAEQIYFGKVDRNHSFESVFNFLKTLGESRLISNPKIAVINNQEARIHIGRKEAYVTTTTTTGQTTTTTAEEVTYVDVGIQLSVTPTINSEGYISMQIKPEISSVVDVLTTPSGNEIPIIDTALAETTVFVKDASTIMIGGLRREEESEQSERFPFLGDIPIIGNLLSSKTKEKERSELLVMITPYIVSGDILTTGGEVEFQEAETKEYKSYGQFDPGIEEFQELKLKLYREKNQDDTKKVF